MMGGTAFLFPGQGSQTEDVRVALAKRTVRDVELVGA